MDIPRNCIGHALQKVAGQQQQAPNIGADLWEGDATKHILAKKGLFSEKGEGIQ